VSGSWQAERGSRRTRRLPREDPSAKVGEDVRVGVGVRVGPVEFQLKRIWRQQLNSTLEMKSHLKQSLARHGIFAT